jgi:hypothetical protein
VKVFRFIAWWWGNLESGARALVVTLSLLVSLLLSLFTFGLQGLLFFLLTLVSIAFFTLLFIAVKAIKAQWDIYNHHLEQEQQRVVDRLRGSR